MYGHLRRDDTAEGKKISSWQKPSPSSGDDATKGEHTQNTTEGANTNRYARKKCGLKPIRPTAMSTSSLNPTTPGKLPQTPRMSFKENEYSRFGNSEFPATPKFGRSESTPELHRMRKMDHLLLSTEKSSSDKTNNILQENQGSNLLNLMSDSLPDIFRKPIIQPQTDSQLSHLSKPAVEEKVSKWGYGPSSFSTGINNTKMSSEPTKETSMKNRMESTNIARTSKEEVVHLTKMSAVTPSSINRKIEFPSWSSLDKSANSSNTILPLVDGSTATKAGNKSDLSLTNDTASALGLSTQVTVKAHLPSIPAPEQNLLTPIKTSATGNQLSHFSSSVYTQKPSEPLPPAPIYPAKTSPKTENALINTQSKQQLLQPPSLMNLVTPSLKPSVSSCESQPPPPQESSENQNKLSAVANNLPPPSARPPHKTKQIIVNGKHYTVMKPLGRGGSSVVFQVLSPEMTDVYALKVVRLDSIDESTAEGYINEVRLLKQLQCLPRVVRLLDYEYNEDEEKLLLVMERGDTDFATVVRNRTSSNAINPTLIRFYWQEMLEAVGEIHQKNVIHSDLKPANFLLVNGGLKLIDFGIATSIQADMTSIMKDSQCGTYNYMAPEAIKSASPAGANQEYKISRKTDVWSLGCILYSLIYKSPPFSKFRDTIEKINAIIDERYAIEFPPYFDPMAVEVAKACLDRNPRNRPTIEQLLLHPYLSCSASTAVVGAVTPSVLRARLEPFMVGDRLSEEAKDVIRKWM